MQEYLETTGLITKLEHQQKNKKRYNVYINEAYAFSIHEDVLVSLQLLKGKKMTAADIQEVLALEEQKRVERTILHYLSFRPRTSLEVKRHLLGKGYQEEIIEEQINHFTEKGYINDREFARQWITERMRTQRKGIYLLTEELRQKGIAQQVIEEIIGSAVNPEEEWEACYQLALKRIERIHEPDPRKAEYKLKQYLARRGFPLDLIQTVYKQIRKIERT